MAASDEEFDDAFDSSVLAQIDVMEAAHTRGEATQDSLGDALDPAWEKELLDAFDALDDEVAQGRAPFAENGRGRGEDVHTAPGGAANKAARVQGAPPEGHATAPRPTLATRPRATRPDAPRTTAPAPSAPPRSAQRCTPPHASPRASQQLTQQGLFGQAYTPSAVQSSQGSVSMAPAGPPSQSTGGFAWTAVKEWDHSVFLQGNRVTKQVDDEEEDTLYERPATAPPFVDHGIKLQIDCAAAQTWIYPVNKPLRAYQLNIVQKALFHNVLVALPTGLGKTFIAAVVILNMFRWFPEGKSA